MDELLNGINKMVGESTEPDYQGTIGKLNKEHGLTEDKGFKLAKTDDPAYKGVNILHPTGVGMTPNELEYAMKNGSLKGYKELADKREKAMRENTFKTDDRENALKMLKGNLTDEEWGAIKDNKDYIEGYLSGKYQPKELKNAARISLSQPQSDYDLFNSIHYSPSKYGRDNYVVGEEEEIWNKLSEHFDLPKYENNKYSFRVNDKDKKVYLGTRGIQDGRGFGGWLEEPQDLGELKRKEGKSQPQKYDPRNREQSTSNHNKIIDKINARYATDKISKKEYWDAINREVDRWNNEQRYWYEKEVEGVNDEEISEALDDSSWSITQNDTVDSYSKYIADQLKVPQDKVLKVMEKEQGRKLGLTENLSKLIYGNNGQKQYEESREETVPVQKITESAIEEFGLTNDFSKGFYMLPDGRMLDGTYKGATRNRSVDHRDISSSYDNNNVELEDDSASAGMLDFMKNGNIRMKPESHSIDLSVKPTQQQLDQIYKMFKMGRLDNIEITNPNDKYGQSIAYLDDIKNERQIADFFNKYFNTQPTETQPTETRYPKGTSKEYTDKVNADFQKALPILEKLGIKVEDFGGKENEHGGYEDNSKLIMDKYVFEPFRKKYPNGNNEVWEREYKPIYDAIDAVLDKNYNDWYIKKAPHGF